MNLLESLKSILDEGKRGDYLIANFSTLIEPLYNKFKEDHSFDMSVIESKATKILKARESGEMSEADAKKEILRYVLDEVENKYPQIKKNMYWVMKQYVANKFLFEDFPRVETKLEKFERAKNKKKLENPDINKYDYPKLVDVLDTISDDELKSDNQRRKEVQKALDAEDPNEVKSNDFEIVWKTPELIVFHPFTYNGEVACVPTVDKNGRACEWCTRASREATRWGTNGEGYFNNYSKDGPLFPMHDLKKDEWYQLHFQSDQFKDWKDNEVPDLDKFLNARPYIKEFIVDYVNKNPEVTKKHRRWAKYLDSSKLPPEIYHYMKFDGNDMEYIQGMNADGTIIPENVREMLIRNNPTNIKYLKAPSVELQEFALSRNPNAFRITCPKEIREKVIEKDPDNLLKFYHVKTRVNGEIKELTANDIFEPEEIKRAVAKKPGLIISIFNMDEFKKFRTEDLLKFALQKDAEQPYPDRIDYQMYSKIPEHLRSWVKEIYKGK